MTTTPAQHRATYADLHTVPDHLIAEMVNGELITSPRPAIPHVKVSSVLGMALGGPFHLGHGGPGGWMFLFEPELHLGEDVLVPDLAGWRRERMPEVPSSQGITLPPDWVCEVLSPSTMRLDRVTKMPLYARVGVHHSWLLDPSVQVLEVYRRSEVVWVCLGAWAGDTRVRAEPFGDIELDLSLLWVRS